MDIYTSETQGVLRFIRLRKKSGGPCATLNRGTGVHNQDRVYKREVQYCPKFCLSKPGVLCGSPREEFDGEKCLLIHESRCIRLRRPPCVCFLNAMSRVSRSSWPLPHSQDEEDANMRRASRTYKNIVGIAPEEHCNSCICHGILLRLDNDSYVERSVSRADRLLR